MPAKIITFRASEAEWKALNWFADLGEQKSGSSAIRSGLLLLIEKTTNFPRELLQEIKHERVKSIRCGKMRPKFMVIQPLLETAKPRQIPLTNAQIGLVPLRAPRKPINSKAIVKAPKKRPLRKRVKK
jgi:hypothetical protein